MVNSNIDTIISSYISVVSQYDHVLGSKTKRLYKQTEKIKGEISKLSTDQLKYFLDCLLSHESLSVQLNAAVIAIENQYRSDDAKRIISNIREMTVMETKSYAPLWALTTDHILDENYPYIYNIYKQTTVLMYKSILKDSIDMNNRSRVETIISKQDRILIERYIDFLNNRKNNGTYICYGALLAFKYNYHIDEARNNLIMISSDNRNWGKMSKICLKLIDELGAKGI